MSEKVLLTKEQVGAIDLWLSRFDDKEALVNSHSKIIEDNGTDLGWNWDEEFRSLNGLSVARLAKALFVGYEIEEPTPQFERGDKVVVWKRVITLGDFRIFEGKRQWAMSEPPFMWMDEEDLTKPTKEEIYWLHDLKRNYVQDFREGDVVIDIDSEIFVVAEDAEEIRNCTISDAVRWAKQDDIKAIYPVDSRKPYRKEEN